MVPLRTLKSTHRSYQTAGSAYHLSHDHHPFLVKTTDFENQTEQLLLHIATGQVIRRFGTSDCH